MADLNEKHWIQGAIKHPGALHRMLGIPEGEDIPVSVLHAAAKKGGKLGERARLALTLKHMHEDINQAFTEYLKEDHDYPSPYGVPTISSDGVVATGDQNKAAYQVTSDPEVLDKVNAWLAALTTRPYINAYAVTIYLKQKLAIAGLDFKEPKIEGESGQVEVPVTQWGNPTNFTLNFRWVRAHGWYTISAELTGTPVEKAPIAEEDEIDEDTELVDEAPSPFSIINSQQKRKAYQNLRLAKRHKNQLININLRKLLTNAAKAGGKALKVAFGFGGYTSNQGRSTHIHTKALRGKTGTGKISSTKKMI